MIAALLNRHNFQDDLDGSPYAALVEEVGDILYEYDAMGLRGFGGLPRNEYFPEAVALTAWVVTGSSAIEDLWDTSKKRDASKRTLTVEDLRQAMTDIFNDFFGTNYLQIDESTARDCLFCYCSADLAVYSSSKLGSSSASGAGGCCEGLLPLAENRGAAALASSSSDEKTSSS